MTIYIEEMNPTLIEVLRGIFDWFFVYLALIFPLLTYVAMRRRFAHWKPRHRFVNAAFTAWLAMHAFNLATMDFEIAYLIFNPSPGDHDGTSMTVHMDMIIFFFFGWILPLLSLAVFIGIAAVIQTIRKRLKPKPTEVKSDLP